MSSVRVAEQSDLGRVCRTATRAFAEDPLLRWFFPEAADYEANAPGAFEHLARRSIALGCTYVTPDAAAVGIYFPPGRPEPEPDGVEKPNDGPQPPADVAERFTALGELMAQNTPPEAHWYLNVLATHPDWQRQGLGAAIIAPVGDRCSAEGLPLYLETETVANVAYYRHVGFEVRTEWDLPLGGPHMWGMLRQP